MPPSVILRSIEKYLSKICLEVIKVEYWRWFRFKLSSAFESDQFFSIDNDDDYILEKNSWDSNAEESFNLNEEWDSCSICNDNSYIYIPWKRVRDLWTGSSKLLVYALYQLGTWQ